MHRNAIQPAFPMIPATFIDPHSMSTLPLVPPILPSPSTFSSFLFQSPSNLMMPPFNNLNLNAMNTINTAQPNMNGFVFPSSATANNQMDSRSITASFLKMYYNELHSNPANLRKFYHFNAEIDRSGLEPQTSNASNDIFSKLALLEGVSFVDIDKIVDQRAMNNSVLIRVNGTMQFQGNTAKQFEQILFINKAVHGMDGCWLIQNDIFWFIHDRSLDQSQKQREDEHKHEEKEQDTVSKTMMNRYYEDASYQSYDNNLAIFVRPIPNTVTHSNLAFILKESLKRKSNATNRYIDVSIDYIDVNYHKQFAFIYFGNRATLDLALEMKEMNINGELARIQIKKSKNRPRTFGMMR